MDQIIRENLKITHACILNKGDGAVVLSNSVATVYKWRDFYPFVPKSIVNPARDLKKYLGAYYFENSDSVPEIHSFSSNNSESGA